jgi:hypothetical protein
MSRHAAPDVALLARHSDVPDSARILSDLNAAPAPFSAHDITAGTENELQAAVVGHAADVDLPLAIRSSNYFKNVLKRAAAGESPRRVFTQLEEYVSSERVQAWDNSWVRLPMVTLMPSTRALVYQDLQADKHDAGRGRRQDVARFLFRREGEEWLRIPISYLLKLALAEAVSPEGGCPPDLTRIGRRLMAHFLNDNSSPETVSFYIVSLSPATGMGRAAAKEMAQRFLLTQLLMMYANQRLLCASGQRALAYFAPHPPIRQKAINTLVSDSFYRELFMNPCLSGWEHGEAKHRYMQLCHEVLSRSQLNAVIKLKDAGIITRNLIVLPSLSNISLANNGTHVSLGSRILTDLARRGLPYDEHHEKYVGDLVIKIIEHFLPLFVGTYSAAPYRLDFSDFHPERALGFLPHELEATHLRMLWRRWKKKARLSVFGHAVTPLGPLWLDKLLSRVLCLKGDCVTDFRLIDYLVALLSTSESPALDGRIGNDRRLKQDLSQLGVFDESMSLYLLYKLRPYRTMGFCGFEGRQYSLFESFNEDIADGITMQALVTALAFKYITGGMIRHDDIPDSPGLESERRQFIFGAAVGIATYNVKRATGNRFLQTILSRTRRTRDSRRYTGYLRVRLDDYRSALLQVLEEDAQDLIEQFHAHDTVARLKARLVDEERQAVSHKLMAGILSESGVKSALSLSAEDFNASAERYYREPLRIRQLAEAFDVLEDDVKRLDERAAGPIQERLRPALRVILGRQTGRQFLNGVRRHILNESADADVLRRCIHLTLLAIAVDAELVDRSDKGDQLCSA